MTTFDYRIEFLNKGVTHILGCPRPLRIEKVFDDFILIRTDVKRIFINMDAVASIEETIREE